MGMKVKLTLKPTLIKARKKSAESQLKQYPSGLVYQKKGAKWVYFGKVGTKKVDDALAEAAKGKIPSPSPQKPLDYVKVDSIRLEKLIKDTTRRDRITEGQKVSYHGAFHSSYRGMKGTVIGMGERGYALVRFSDGKVKTANWRDIKAEGEIKPYSLYEKLKADDVYEISGELKIKVNTILDKKIGKSGKSYRDLASFFKKKGFSFIIVGGTVRDILQGKDVKDVDFVVDCSDRELLSIVKEMNPAWANNAVTNSTIGLVSIKDAQDTVDITPVHKYSPEMNDEIKGWNLKDDAESRDFTMNSLHIDPFKELLIDGTGRGVEDIKKKTLNYPLPGILKISPRYILRTFKFLARGYSLSPEADKTLKENLKYVKYISPRMKESFFRRQIVVKDGLKGMEKFKELFKKYDANIWNTEYEIPWKGVYRSSGGKV